MNIKYSTKCHKCNRFKNNECYFDSDTIKGCKANNYYHFVSREEDVRKDEMKRVLNIVDGVIDSNIHTCNHYVEIMQEIEKELTEE